MNADILIRARKVFVEDNIVEYSETCPHCTSKGLSSKLRYFYLSLDEAIYKCEHENCLYPFERFMFKSLIDNSVYYYEEVFDGAREAYLRIPLDEHNKYEPQNPISTKVFCESQRNSDIESYSCDFSELFDDFDTEPEVKAPAIENPDFLDFLDETGPKTEDFNASEVLDENGIDNLINNILNESPMKDSPAKPALKSTQTSQKTRQNESKSEPKLSKCLEHIKKAKNAKSNKAQEKTKESFATTIRKARKSQSKPHSDTPPIKTEPESEQKPPPNPPLRLNAATSNPPRKPSAMANLFKSTGFLRPTELAQRLGSLKMTRVDSEFLRQYMKAKEEKEFADEPSCKEGSSAMYEPMDSVQQTQVMSKPNPSSMGNAKRNIAPCSDQSQGASSTDQKGQSAAKKKASSNGSHSKKSIKKEPTTDEVTNENAVKKVRKPRAKIPKNADAKVEPTSACSNVSDTLLVKHEPNTNSKRKEVKEPSKRKSTSKNKKVDPNLTDAQKLNINQEVAIKPESKGNNRKRKSSTSHGNDSSQSKTDKDSMAGKVPPAVKRPRKQKQDNEPKTGETEEKEQKPKRRQSTKSKPSSVKIDVPNQLPPNSAKDADVKSKRKPPTATVVSFIPVIRQQVNESGSSSSSANATDDSETSTELLFGFLPPEQSLEVEPSSEVQCSNVNEVVAVVKAKTHKPTRKKSTDRKPKDTSSKKVKNEHSSGSRSSSKRSKRDDIESKVKKPKIESKQKSQTTPTKSPSDDFELLHINSTSTNETNSSDTAPAIQQDLADDGSECCAVIEMIIESSPMEQKATTSDASTLAIVENTEPNLEESSLLVRDQDSNANANSSQQYYMRKNFKKVNAIDQTIAVDTLLDDWDDSESEQSEKQKPMKMQYSCHKSSECQDNEDAASIISITSETSDSSVALVGDPYYADNPNGHVAKPTDE